LCRDFPNQPETRHRAGRWHAWRLTMGIKPGTIEAGPEGRPCGPRTICLVAPLTRERLQAAADELGRNGGTIVLPPGHWTLDLTEGDGGSVL
jgi:hypothetical protein